MGSLKLYAVSIDTVRDWFASSDPTSAELLRQAEAFVGSSPHPTLIGKVGPLFKHPVAPIIDLPRPTMDDARALVEGRTLPPGRLRLGWLVVQHWLDAAAAGHVEVTLSGQQLGVLDFRLVSGGLSSQYSLETIVSRDPQLPVLPAPGMSVGWMPSAHALRASAQWPQAAAELPEDVADAAAALRSFFCQLPAWDAASSQAVDVLAIHR